MVKKEPIWKRGILDLSAAFFLIGGVVSLISFILMIPISTIYPLKIQTTISFIYLIVLIVGLICAIEAFECYRFASKRFLMKAGIRGIVVGAILLSMGVIAGSELKPSVLGLTVGSDMIIASAVLILIAGILNYIYREL